MTSPAMRVKHIDRLSAGLVFVGLIALASVWFVGLPAFVHTGLSALTIAIVAGVISGNSFFSIIAARCSDGVDYAKGNLLRLGIVLFGFRITFQQIVSIGWVGALIDILMIGSTFWLAVQLGTKVFKLDRQTAMLVGIGSSICGAAAVLAAEPIIKGQAQKVSIAVATVVIFGTLSMFLYPLAYPYLHLSETAYGLYAGSTIHEVAQVVGAGKAVSEPAAQIAVIEKMLRVMLLAPFLLILGLKLGHDQRDGEKSHRVQVPVFAVLFIVAAAVNSLGFIPPVVMGWINGIDTVVLAMAMAALGLRTHVSAFRQAGPRPLLLGACLFLFLTVGGYFINLTAMTLLQ
jgi:uncharacterized integral membrane protein (TIGR00698 family)